MNDLAAIIDRLLPNARIVVVHGVDVTLHSDASPKAIFDAEAALRKETGVMYELFMARKEDANKLRVKLAKLRGIGGAT